MNKTLKQAYLKYHHKFILPKNVYEEPTEQSKQLATTVGVNFASIGFPINSDDLHELAKASPEDIQEFYKDYMPILKDMIGVRIKDSQIFYPNFPQEVIEKDRMEIFFDQVIYGLSGLQIEPSKYEEIEEHFPFIGDGINHVISGGSEEDFKKTLTNIMSSVISYSPTQLRELKTVLPLYPSYSERKDRNQKAVMDIIPDSDKMKNRENLVALACILEDTGHNEGEKLIKSPTDLLRYAAVRCVEAKEKKNGPIDLEKYPEIYQKASLRFGKNKHPFTNMSRPLRRYVAYKLNNFAKDKGDKCVAGEMRDKEFLWKKVRNLLHIEKDFPHLSHAKEAIKLYNENKDLGRYNTRIEEAIKKHDTELAIQTAKERPGDFNKRFDKLYRMAKEDHQENLVTDTLNEIGKKSGIKTLIDVKKLMVSRTEEETERVFKIPTEVNGIFKKFKTDEKNRTPYTKDEVLKIQDIIINCMDQKFPGKEWMGKVYVDPDIQEITVPSDIRATNEAIETYGIGSKIPLHTEKDVLRLFCHWTNTASGKRIDNDLSAKIIMNDGGVIDCSWNGSYYDGDGMGNPRRMDKDISNRMFVFSGDEQDGGPVNGKGVAEYIDLNLPVLKEKGAKYVIANVNDYTCVGFANQTHTSFGTMERNYQEMGENFEPKTVSTKFELTNNSIGITPIILDVQNDKMIWLDMPNDKHVMTNMKPEEIDEIVETATLNAAINLYQLIELNVKHNGEFVDNIKDADTVFISKYTLDKLPEEERPTKDQKVIMPYDLEYITGVLMADGDKEVARERELHKEEEKKVTQQEAKKTPEQLRDEAIAAFKERQERELQEFIGSFNQTTQDKSPQPLTDQINQIKEEKASHKHSKNLDDKQSVR